MGLGKQLSFALLAGLALPTSLLGQRPPPMPGAPQVKARPLGPAPSGLQVAAVSPGTVLLVWQQVADPAGYRVYRTADLAVPAIELTTAPIADAKFLDAAAAPGAVYYYSVAADYPDTRIGTVGPLVVAVPMVTRSGAVVSAPTSAAPAALPVSAPTNLLASTTPVEVTLSWNGPLSAYSYEVARVAPSGQVTALTPPGFPFVGTTFADRGAEPGMSYRYDVTAIGGRGDRATVQKTVVTPLPVNPIGLASAVKLYNIQSQMTATLNVLFTVNGEVTLSWQSVPGATSYRVAGPNLYQYRQVFGTSTTITQVPPGVAKYTVVADFINNQNKRFAKDQPPASIVVRVGSAPVEGFSTTQPGGGMFQWYDLNGANGFHLFFADRPGGPYQETSDPVGATWGRHTTAAPGRTYWYKVLSTFPSAPAAMTEPLMVRKAGGHQVTGLEVVSAQAGAVKIMWHPIAYAWYHVYAPSADVVLPLANWLNSEFLDVNTVKGKTYSYHVCATGEDPYAGPNSYRSTCADISVTVP